MPNKISLTTLLVASLYLSSGCGGGGGSIGPDPNGNTGDSKKWISVSAGDDHTCGIKEGGSLWCWGNNFYGELGNDKSGEDAFSNIPIQIVKEASWKTVSCGNSFTCAVKVDGTLWCWGIKSANLGLGKEVAMLPPSPNPLQVGSDTDWEFINAGSGHACAIKNNGTLWCWGTDYQGELGSGSKYYAAYSPTQVGSDTNWKYVNPYLNSGYNFAIKTDGMFVAWAYDTCTKYDSVTQKCTETVGHYSPEQIGTEKWSFASSTNEQTCVVKKSDGTLWCWTSDCTEKVNTWGDCYLRSRDPVQASAESWIYADGEEYYGCGIKANGTLWCWGSDSRVSIGIGGSVKAESAVKIGSENNWSTISIGLYHLCGIKTDGTLWCWGDGTYGQLGNGESGADCKDVYGRIGTCANKSVPTQVK